MASVANLVMTISGIQSGEFLELRSDPKRRATWMNFAWRFFNDPNLNWCCKGSPEGLWPKFRRDFSFQVELRAVHTLFVIYL